MFIFVIKQQKKIFTAILFLFKRQIQRFHDSPFIFKTYLSTIFSRKFITVEGVHEDVY